MSAMQKQDSNNFSNFAHYKVKELLGQGAMGRVWLAHDENLQIDVAIKEPKIDLLGSSSQRESLKKRFLREARAAARLSHPNIVAVRTVETFDDTPVIVMEYIKGSTLGCLLKDDHLNLEQKKSIFAQLLSAVAFAHSEGIVHRDLKPDNVLVTEDGQVKLTDFGIAHLLNATAALTKTGMSVGTPAYMAPEQILGKETDARVDVFALGALAYEMLAGKNPFTQGEAMHHIAVTHRIVNEDVDFQALCESESIFRDLIKIALSKEADDRFESAAAMQAAWEKAQESLMAEVENEIASAEVNEPIEADVGVSIDAGTNVGVGADKSIGTKAKKFKKSGKRKAFFAIAATLIVAVFGAGFLISTNHAAEQERIELVATTAVERFFEDSSHTSLAHFNSINVSYVEGLLGDAREDVANVANGDRQSELVALIDRAQNFWEIQLHAHNLVEALFCEYGEEDCPGDLVYDCYPRQDNTEESLEAARLAIEEVTTEAVREEKNERIGIAVIEFELISAIRENMTSLSEDDIDEDVLDELDQKASQLLNSNAQIAFGGEIQDLRDDLAERLAAAEEEAARIAAEEAAAAARAAEAVRRQQQQQAGGSGSGGSGGGATGGGSGSGGSGGGSTAGGGSGGASPPPGGGFWLPWWCACGNVMVPDASRCTECGAAP